jgi:hypothetical protein
MMAHPALGGTTGCEDRDHRPEQSHFDTGPGSTEIPHGNPERSRESPQVITLFLT